MRKTKTAFIDYMRNFFNRIGSEYTATPLIQKTEDLAVREIQAKSTVFLDPKITTGNANRYQPDLDNIVNIDFSEADEFRIGLTKGGAIYSLSNLPGNLIGKLSINLGLGNDVDIRFKNEANASLGVRVLPYQLEDDSGFPSATITPGNNVFTIQVINDHYIVSHLVPIEKPVAAPPTAQAGTVLSRTYTSSWQNTQPNNDRSYGWGNEIEVSYLQLGVAREELIDFTVFVESKDVTVDNGRIRRYNLFGKFQDENYAYLTDTGLKTRLNKDSQVQRTENAKHRYKITVFYAL